MTIKKPSIAERLVLTVETSAAKAANRRDVQSAWRHFLFPAIAGGVDAARQIIMPVLDAWMDMTPVPVPNLKQSAGIVLHAAVIAGASAGARYVQRWWIDLRDKLTPKEEGV